MKYNCLIVDDEVTIAQTTCEYFNMFDIPSAYVTSYEECFDFLNKNTISLLLLDINLGDKSGFELCKKLRATSNIPILFISARTSDDDILTALNIGGDDYIQKPYVLSILIAKVKAVLKRYEHSSTGQSAQDTAVSGYCPITIDYNYRQAKVNGIPVKLKDMEFKLLAYLMEHTNRVIRKEELFEQVWQDKFIGDGTLSVHIRHLREKLEAAPNNPVFIKTLWGVGYVFEVQP